MTDELSRTIKKVNNLIFEDESHALNVKRLAEAVAHFGGLPFLQKVYRDILERYDMELRELLDELETGSWRLQPGQDVDNGFHLLESHDFVLEEIPVPMTDE